MQPFPGYGLNDLYLSTLLLLLPKSNYPIKRVEIDFYKTVPRMETCVVSRETWREENLVENFSTLFPVNDLSVNNNCNQFLATALLASFLEQKREKKRGKKKKERKRRKTDCWLNNYGKLCISFNTRKLNEEATEREQRSSVWKGSNSRKNKQTVIFLRSRIFNGFPTRSTEWLIGV